MKSLTVATAVAALLLALVLPEKAWGQPLCGDRAAIVADLALQYGEHPIGRGLNHAGLLVELFVSPSGTWTATVTAPGGPTCLTAAGEGWEVYPVPVKGEGA